MSIFEERESEVRGYSRVYTTTFDKALNARQTDDKGKEYIDFFAGAGVLNFGHNNERMTKAVVDYIQSNGVTHSLDMQSTAKQKFMERFVKTIMEPRKMPHKMQFMGPTGTNAVEAALKIARRATGRREVVAFTHGFHGMTLGSLACTANQVFRNAAGIPLEHVTHHPFDKGETGKNAHLGGGVEQLKHLRALYEDTSSAMTPPAAFLVETIQAEGGVNVATEEWLMELQQLAKDTDALLIIDDIQVGMGRTGNFFSFDDLNLDPDIVCLAKGIGGWGTPMALNLVKPEIDKHWAPGEHTGTFRGQGLSFVAGHEALSYFESDDLMNEVKNKAQVMRETLAPLLEKHADVELRGKGMILGLDVGSGDKAKGIVTGAFNSGLLVAACGTGGRVVKLIPPLTIPQSDLEEGLKILVDTATKALEAA